MTCLDDELLVRLGRGLVPEGELSTADEHLDQCETCRRVLASVVNEAASESRIVGDRYELGALVGAGAHGLVWEARDVKLERRVALKMMRRQSSAPLAEARLMARVSHASVVQVFDVGEGFVAMEFVAGPTLRTWMKKSPTMTERLRVMREAGEALAAVHHAGLVHRDFKPDNVLIDATGRARVTDFGLAQTESDGSIGGTPAYMAPELLSGAPGDQRSDQFAYCVTLFEVLSGHRPGKGAMPSSVPSPLIDVVTRGLSKDPAARFGSMDELLAAMQKKPGTRWPWFAAAAVIAVVTVAALQPHETSGPTTTSPVTTPPLKKTPLPVASPQLERDFLEEEALVEALPPPGTEITIAPDCVRTFKQPRLTKVIISNPDVVDAAANEEELQLEAHEFGWSRVTLQSGSKKTTWTVRVREPIELPPTHVQLASGESYDATVGGLHRLSIGDSSIIDVERRDQGTVTFRALKAGRTNCLLWTNDARRIELLFDVTAADEDALALEVGVQRVLKVKPFVGVVVKPASRVSVEVVGASEVLLLPREAGEGELTFTDEDGKPTEIHHFRIR